MRRRRQLAGLNMDTMLGWGFLVAGVGLGFYLVKRNTPGQVAAALNKQVAGLMCGSCRRG